MALNHINVDSNSVSTPVLEMITYFDKFLTDLIEVEQLTGDERAPAFVKVACDKYELMSAEDAVRLSRGEDV